MPGGDGGKGGVEGSKGGLDGGGGNLGGVGGGLGGGGGGDGKSLGGGVGGDGDSGGFGGLGLTFWTARAYTAICMGTHVPGRFCNGEVLTQSANCCTVSCVDVNVHDTTDVSENPLHGDGSRRENVMASTVATAVLERIRHRASASACETLRVLISCATAKYWSR